MSAARQKAADLATSGRQNFELRKIMKALDRCEAACRSVAVFSRFVDDIEGDGRIHELETTLVHTGILADTAVSLQLDAAQALHTAFPDVRWGYPKRDPGVLDAG